MDEMNKKILWVLPYLPWPITSGGKSRQYNLMKVLSERGHKITLLVQSKSAPDDAFFSALSFLDDIVFLPRRKTFSIKTIGSILFSRYPMLTCVNGFNHKLSMAFEKLLEQQWDVIQVEHSYTFQPYAAQLLKANKPFILTEHNVESGLGAATYSRLPAVLQPFSHFDRARYRWWEKQVLQGAKYVIAVTKEDASALAEIRQKEVDVVINGVDTRAFENVTLNASSQRILFIGNYEYAPNIDAVEWIMDDIMPRVWQQSPNVKVMICGYGMPESWPEKWSDKRIEWQGYVSDLTEVQAKSSLFLVPLRHGGGSKLKVLEAMAAGLPLVSTAQGVSGLNVQMEEHYLGGETTEALSGAVVNLLKSRDDLQQMSESARRYVKESHDWKIAAQQLEHVYEKL